MLQGNLLPGLCLLHLFGSPDESRSCSGIFSSLAATRNQLLFQLLEFLLRNNLLVKKVRKLFKFIDNAHGGNSLQAQPEINGNH
jgi:hypothetical protein